MVDENTVIKIVAVVGIALLVVFGYSTIQKTFGSLLPSDANVGIAGALVILGLLGYLWIRRKAEDIRE
jgi:protein-S-isoprenylcysteine O-methyltransferase Ste14